MRNNFHVMTVKDLFTQKRSLTEDSQFLVGQDKCSCSESDKSKTDKNIRVPIDGKSSICCECGKASALENNSDCQEKCHRCVSYCKLCGRELKQSGCNNQVCQITTGKLDDDVKNVNLLENSGKELHEDMSVKDEIDINEFPFENQVSEI